MFSGIIEGIAVVKSVKHDQDNVDITLTCPFANELAVSQSLAHNGVCLTITSVNGNEYTTTAMRETLLRSNIGLLEVGSEVNVERPMPVNGRLDGHIVQGHVDTTAECVGIEDAQGSYIFTFKYKFDRELAKKGYFCVDKGSVTVNGVSLTVCNPTDDTFQVNIIPYTFEHTNFHTFCQGSVVNIEFDVLGKMVSRLVQLAK
jgi:riboflavin synthase